MAGKATPLEMKGLPLFGRHSRAFGGKPEGAAAAALAGGVLGERPAGGALANVKGVGVVREMLRVMVVVVMRVQDKMRRQWW